MNPNPEQEKLIEGLQGTYLVDAGAGTGKTFAVTRRYINLVEDVEPEDVFLGTFTRSAADEMKQRIASQTDYSASRIHEAPISTFHSYCKKVLDRHGLTAPRRLGIESDLEAFETVEGGVREQQIFRKFYENFRRRHPEYSDFYRLVDRPSSLLSLLKSLAARGVIPREEEWFLDSEKYLQGDREEYFRMFEEANRPRNGKNGNKKQSLLRNKLYTMKYKDFRPDAPDYGEVAGDRGCKQVRKDFRRKSFEEERDELQAFVRTLYFEYLERSVSNGYLNFSFVMALAYVTLYTDEEAREAEAFDYVMIDEFQDTNEVQLKISLLLTSSPNICVVGDWKQSIYSFQYADVDNIRKFRHRMNRYIDELNQETRKVDYTVDPEKIKLKRNYRSRQEILDAASQAFNLRGSKREKLEEKDIESLKSVKGEGGSVEKLLCQDETLNVLHEIQRLIEEEGLKPGEITVLSRTRSFGLELQRKAEEHGIPLQYEGGIELFNTREGKIALAWLRALQNPEDRKAWAPLLHEAGAGIETSQRYLEEGLPPVFEEFLARVEGSGLETQLREVFDRYGLENPVSEKIIEVLTDAYSSSFMTRGELVEFVEESIEESEIYEVESRGSDQKVAAQTVHNAKGREYRCVFVSDVNNGSFPSRGGGFPAIYYDEVQGLRKRKELTDQGLEVYNWNSFILNKVTGSRYDEERRLMYVAATRAEEKLFLTAEEGRQSPFYHDFEASERSVEEEPKESGEEDSEPDALRLEKDFERRSRLVTPSQKAGLEEADRDTGRGDRVHRFMKQYVEDGVEPEKEAAEELARKIDLMDNPEVEKEFTVPVDGEVLTGRADLVDRREDRVKIFDVKTGGEGLEENYRKQLETYEKAFERLEGVEAEASVIRIGS